MFPRSAGMHQGQQPQLQLHNQNLPQQQQQPSQQHRMIAPYTQQYYHPYNPPPVMHYPQHISNTLPPAAPPAFQPPTSAPQLQTGYHGQGYYDPYIANYLPSNNHIMPSMVETPTYSHLSAVPQHSWMVQNPPANSYAPTNESDLSNRPQNMDYSKVQQDFHLRPRGQRMMSHQNISPAFPSTSVAQQYHHDYERHGSSNGRQYYAPTSDNNPAYKFRDQNHNNGQIKAGFHAKPDYYSVHAKASNSTNDGKDHLDVETVDPSSHYSEENPDALSNDNTEET